MMQVSQGKDLEVFIYSGTAVSHSSLQEGLLAANRLIHKILWICLKEKKMEMLKL